MREGTRNLLDKADRAIRAASSLLSSVGAEFAAGRAYYAMFYIAEALMHERSQRFGKHSAVHAPMVRSLPRPACSTPSSIVGSSMPSMLGSRTTTMPRA
jgi:hypothetical protein